MKVKRAVVLASGRGSNFAAVLEGVRNGNIRRCEIAALVTDRRQTGAEQIAAEAGVPVRLIAYKDFAQRSEYDAVLLDALRELRPDVILTLGYMRILAPELVRAYAGRIINIHPSLLPAFPGIHSARQAFEYGVKIAGATVHFVDEGVDTGPVIAQAAVEVPEDATADDLAEIILIQEHRILVRAVDLFCSDRLTLVEGGNQRKKVKVLT